MDIALFNLLVRSRKQANQQLPKEIFYSFGWQGSVVSFYYHVTSAGGQLNSHKWFPNDSQMISALDKMVWEISFAFRESQSQLRNLPQAYTSCFKASSHAGFVSQFHRLECAHRFESMNTTFYNMCWYLFLWCFIGLMGGFMTISATSTVLARRLKNNHKHFVWTEEIEWPVCLFDLFGPGYNELIVDNKHVLKFRLKGVIWWSGICHINRIKISSPLLKSIFV